MRRTMYAKHESKCRACKRTIYRYDRIVYVRQEGASRGSSWHVDCAPADDGKHETPKPSTPARHIVRRFDSLSALVECGDRDQSCDGIRLSRSVDDYYRTFSETGSYAEARELALHGWHDIRPDVDQITGEIADSLKETVDQVFHPVFDVTGACVDVGKYLTGEPECMVDFAPIEVARQGKVVTILVDMTALSSVPAATIMARGAAVIALIETLAKLQHTVELWAESTVTAFASDARHTTLIRVKDAAEPLDVDGIMFALAHPSWLRRLVFASNEVLEDHSTRSAFRFGVHGTGYGKPSSVTQASTVGAHVVVNRPSGYADKTVNQPVEWIIDTLHGLGIETSE